MSLLRIRLELRLQGGKLGERRIRIRFFATPLIGRAPGSRRAIVIAPPPALAASEFLWTRGTLRTLFALRPLALSLTTMIGPTAPLTRSCSIIKRAGGLRPLGPHLTGSGHRLDAAGRGSVGALRLMLARSTMAAWSATLF
jgi:hypothetical protein